MAKILKDNKKRSTCKSPSPVSYCSSVSSSGLETHRVETEDGYILGLFRIKNLKKSQTGNEGKVEKYASGESHQEVIGEKSKKLSPVLMIAGLGNNGTEWILLEPAENALPNMLTNEGYDCWMGCVRGTNHSKTHKSLKTNSRKFWDFSLDEMSKFDIPAFIDYILKVTDSKDLFYVGLSMGGATILATLCLKPEYSEKVRAVVALAPGVYGNDFKTCALRFGTPIAARVFSYRFIYRRSIGNKSMASIAKMLIPSFTNINRENFARSCLNFFGRMTGGIVSGCNTDREMFNRLAENMPSPTSIKHVAHIAQMFSSGNFQMFNYGRSGNMKRYGNPKPPLFNLGLVSVPVATFTSEHDHLIPNSGVLRTSMELPNLISHTNITTKKFAHCDFILGRNVHTLLYDQVVQIFKRYSGHDFEPAQSEDFRVDTDINLRQL